MNFDKFNKKCKVNKIINQLKEVNASLEEVFNNGNSEEVTLPMEYVNIVTPWVPVSQSEELPGKEIDVDLIRSYVSYPDLDKLDKKIKIKGWYHDNRRIHTVDDKTISVYRSGINSINGKDITLEYRENYTKFSSNGNLNVKLPNDISVTLDMIPRYKDYFGKRVFINSSYDYKRNNFVEDKVCSLNNDTSWYQDMRFKNGLTILVTEQKEFNSVADLTNYIKDTIKTIKNSTNYTENSYTNFIKDIENLGININKLDEVGGDANKFIKCTDITNIRSRRNQLDRFEDANPYEQEELLIGSVNGKNNTDFNMYQNCSKMDMDNIKKGYAPLPEKILVTYAIHVPLDLIMMNNKLIINNDKKFIISNKVFQGVTDFEINYKDSQIIQNNNYTSTEKVYYTLNKPDNTVSKIVIKNKGETPYIINGDFDVLIWKESLNGKMTHNYGKYRLPTDEKERDEYLRYYFNIFTTAEDALLNSTEAERIEAVKFKGEQLKEEKKIEVDLKKIEMEGKKIDADKVKCESDVEIAKSKVKTESIKHETSELDKALKIGTIITSLAASAAMIYTTTTKTSIIGLGFLSGSYVLPVAIGFFTLGCIFSSTVRENVKETIEDVIETGKTLVKTVINAGKTIINGVKTFAKGVYKGIRGVFNKLTFGIF